MNNIPEQELRQLEGQIANLITEVNKGVAWANEHLKEEQRKATNSKIKKIRRDLKKIKYAITQKPSAAVYGESQVGKSYLIKNLLSKSGQPFEILDRSSNMKYDFLAEINPRGEGTEATSVVTRFSTDVKIPDEKFPIKIRLLSPKDIVLFLADSYFSDLTDHDLPSSEAIEAHIATLSERFPGLTAVQESFTEDDIFDIKEYLQTQFRSFTHNLMDSGFWDFLAARIQAIPPEHWDKLFEIVWGKNNHINEIFRKLIQALGKLEFSEVVYAEFRSVLRKHGTILHVARLREINGDPLYEDVSRENYIQDVELVFLTPAGNKTTRIQKSILCALVAELVFEVDKELEQYKPFLKASDLLDFPGARSRLETRESKLSSEHIGYMVLRGKVSYIFNKYSSQYLISNLLFCNKNLKIEVKYIPKLLNTWIESYIGENPKRRQEFLEHSSVPPLFIIYTFFNQDLTYNSTNDKPDTLHQKWTKRFVEIFENEIVSKDFNWHTNWREGNPYFQNKYMLRDFHYSNTVYQGYEANKVEEGEVAIGGFPNYMEALKRSFLEFDFVQKHFMDPKESWAESATPNKDGSDLILRNLTAVSNNKARTEKFVRDLNLLTHSLREEMNRHYHSDEADKRIIEAARMAGDILVNIDNVFGNHPYMFGPFIKRFVIRESYVYNFYKELINDIVLIEKTNITNYILFRNRNPELSINKKYDENVEVLRKTYRLQDKAEVEAYFKERDIDLNELFYGEANKLKNNSLVLAERLQEHWFDTNLRQSNFESIIDLGFNPSALDNLFENIRLSFRRLNMAEIIAQHIRDYVDRFEKIDEAQEMIADISAGIINKYVTSMGWDYYSEEDLENVKIAKDANDLRFNIHPDEDQTEAMGNEGISVLFDQMHEFNEHISQINPDKEVIKNFPIIRNISRWSDLMVISFVASCDIPNYDPKANNALREVLDRMQEYEFALQVNEVSE